MKKYIFFLLGIILSLLIPLCQTFGQIVPEFGSVQLTYPIKNSVFQQNADGKAKVTFAGQTLKGTYYNSLQFNNLAISIQKYNYDTGTWITNISNQYNVNLENCVNCSNDPNIDPRTFYLYGENTALLSKGWYRVAIGYNTNLNFTCLVTSRFIPLTNWSTFGIGDVYVVAGQSNASGFTRDYDRNLITFEAQSPNTSPDANGVLPPQSLFDSDIPEGSIIYRINKSRSIESIDSPKGLPLFSVEQPQNNIKGFRKFISGKTGDVNVMSIAPNGVDSWAWCRFSKEMVNDVNKKYPVLTFNTAIPNTSVSEWQNTYFNSHLKNTLQMYGGAFGIKAVLWQQGERETANMINDPLYSTANYQTSLNSLISSSRTAMGAGPTGLSWVISRTSYVTTAYNPPPPDSLYVATSIGSTSAGYKYSVKASSAIGNLISTQTNYINNNVANKIFAGPETDVFGKEYRSEAQRVHFDGYEGKTTNGKSGLENLALAWYDKVKLLDNSNNITQKHPNKIRVTKNGSQYTLSLIDPSSGATITSGNFYWTKNELGIENKESINSSYAIPTNVTSPFYITCYYQSNPNSPIVPSQPYYVQQTCSGCRVGNTTSALTRAITIAANGGSGSSTFDNIRDGAWPKVNNCLPWVNMTFDENTNTLVANASSNNTSATRTGTITVIDEVTGLTVQTLNITQPTAKTTCTQTNLSSLTPINPSNERQGYGTMQINKNISGQSLMVGGYTSTNGIGTHANSRIVYNLGGQYNTFAGSVGRDDAADYCYCGFTQNIQFIIKADGNLLFSSDALGPTNGKQDFSVNVSGRSQLELIVNDGGDNIYGDHADWLDAILYCGSAPTCTSPPPPPINVSSSPSTINSGSSSTLSATCSTGSILWSTGATGNTLVVTPTSTTTYTAKCISGSCPVSSEVSIGVTVNSTGCSGITDGLVMGTWTVTNHPLVARFFHSQYWLTQRVGTNPEVFVVRGSAMLQSSNVNLTNSSYYNMINCFGWVTSPFGNLGVPPVSVFATPEGFSFGYLGDGTEAFTANTGGGSGSGTCTDTYLSNNWASATIGDGTPKIGKNYQGGSMIINGTTFTQGIGTHANSEIVYNLGTHSYANFKASVGRDQASYGCNCGLGLPNGGQTIVFKVYNQNTGALIGSSTNNPVTKGINQSASDMVVPIAGVSSIRLVVEDGGDQIWGDWANWANARFTCPNSNFRKSAIPEEEWFWISPNPNDGKFIAKVKLKASQKVVLYLTNTQGKAIKEYSFEAKEGENNFEIQIPNIQDQVYNLRCQAGEESSSKRIVIQK